MTKEERKEMIKTSWELHNQVETAYLNHSATKNDDEWLEKQRLLLADMALHLLQTSMKPEEIKLDRLRDNLHAILTISDQFLPDAGLKKATENLY
ncbi:hypothetical protein D2V08_08715 [Flagellimonas lutimaris]|uniref:Uncharacterized protein n=1 Tax=Flagellimonas lutimaris TaxID=475082 RepID=A0A3A1N8W9_9FLAO|nr:hypothetical protein [Allomuricauda lutimaris]RIV35420.1 hypothetical protein D2V08_08715 [Allomuricauda lutimaris]|tara:strand:- start:1143 stop:1427 length:285 start_codon:yes stop_codon:yes gene_type:complete